MYKCKSCLCRSQTLKGYVQHYRLHSNVANITFPCAIEGCVRLFRTYSAFKSHVARDHQSRKVEKFRTLDIGDSVNTLVTQCPFSFCAKISQNLKDLLQHLKSHIMQGNEVLCPFEGCSLTFKVKSSFSSHITRNHGAGSNRQVSSHLLSHSSEHDTFSDQNFDQDTDLGEGTHNDFDLDNSQHQNDVEENFTELFLKNLALFYLKLTAKHHMPASTVQLVIQEMQAMHTLSQNCLKQHIQKRLNEKSISEVQIADITEEFLANDIFNSVHDDKGPLSTEYRRKQFYKENFSYVNPISIYLGLDKDNIKRYYEYVPIIQTVEVLLKDPSVKQQFNNPVLSEEGILRDFMDGCVAKKNLLFIELPNSIKLILYQDSFEVVNPLGSAKKKHKILAVYVTLGNIYPQNRSKVDQMQLVLLVREVDFKYFGQEAVFRVLVNDLKKIEESGVPFENEYIRGTVAMFLGDNLGSHCIGGFVENFSACVYICRFCLMQSEAIRCGEIFDIYPQRSPDSYKEDLAEVEKNPNLNNYHGIKFDSIFNELKYYHVCSPGLPPCLGHDLFEGVVQYDLALFIKYMIKDKWFTYAYFNQRITTFKYRGSDASNKPSILSDKGDKLGGHAVQNWCLLRLLPVLVGSKIIDTSDPVWKLTLLLRTVVELVCAPEISLTQVACLKLYIEEYLEQRFSLFPEKPLRPKHHFLAHYPRLILQFGPLIRVWTLRFESKHSYFKRCARYSQNFINVCHTFAERHQLLQAYLSNGSRFGVNVNVENAIPFNVGLYNDQIRNAFMAHHSSYEGVVTSLKGEVNGVSYEKDLYIVIGYSQYILVLGHIVMLFQHHTSTICFLIKKVQAEYENEMGYYKIVCAREPVYECVNLSSLKSYCCLPAYRVNNEDIIVLKHAVLDS